MLVLAICKTFCECDCDETTINAVLSMKIELKITICVNNKQWHLWTTHDFYLCREILLLMCSYPLSKQKLTNKLTKARALWEISDCAPLLWVFTVYWRETTICIIQDVRIKHLYMCTFVYKSDCQWCFVWCYPIKN